MSAPGESNTPAVEGLVRTGGRSTASVAGIAPAAQQEYRVGRYYSCHEVAADAGGMVNEGSLVRQRVFRPFQEKSGMSRLRKLFSVESHFPPCER
jgi:hypothetical protein